MRKITGNESIKRGIYKGARQKDCMRTDVCRCGNKVQSIFITSKSIPHWYLSIKSKFYSIVRDVQGGCKDYCPASSSPSQKHQLSKASLIVSLRFPHVQEAKYQTNSIPRGPPGWHFKLRANYSKALHATLRREVTLQVSTILLWAKVRVDPNGTAPVPWLAQRVLLDQARQHLLQRQIWHRKLRPSQLVGRVDMDLCDLVQLVLAARK
jgi:hypothetical protein